MAHTWVIPGSMIREQNRIWGASRRGFFEHCDSCTTFTGASLTLNRALVQCCSSVSVLDEAQRDVHWFCSQSPFVGHLRVVTHILRCSCCLNATWLVWPWKCGSLRDQCSIDSCRGLSELGFSPECCYVACVYWYLSCLAVRTSAVG